jgi:hypothetical protein
MSDVNTKSESAGAEPVRAQNSRVWADATSMMQSRRLIREVSLSAQEER